MATKKPSAAQIAARKLFAQRAKAGYFGKPAAKKRHRNPASGKNHDVGASGVDMEEEYDANPLRRSGHSRNANNLGRSGHSRNANNLARSRSGPAYSRVDPRGSGERPKPRRRNPVSDHAVPPSAFWIFRIKASGERGALVGIITKKDEAVKFARDYASDHKVQVGIVGRK